MDKRSVVAFWTLLLVYPILQLLNFLEPAAGGVAPYVDRLKQRTAVAADLRRGDDDAHLIFMT